MPRSVGRLVLAVLVAAGVGWSPALASPVDAATGRLLVTADASYVLDPAAHAIHVTVDARLQNDKPDSGNAYYYWRDIGWYVHPQAAGVAVTDAQGALRSTVTDKKGYRNVEIHLRNDLLYRRTAALTIRYDLPDGGPRGESPIRAGSAFAAFDVWAWGDPAAGSVTVRLPRGFEPELVGDAMTREQGADGVVLSATGIADPPGYWTALSAANEAALAVDPLTLPGGIHIDVRGWPEDAQWRTSVSDALLRGLPDLTTRIGLPWPVAGTLEVNEAYAPDLGGYAGFYATRDDVITISEDLDTLTILHEASHAWFNDGLFVDRWIKEGLANTYASRVLDDLGIPFSEPTAPSAADPGFVALNAWPGPRKLDDTQAAIEDYAYNAAWYVVSAVVDAVGQAGMQAVFEAAANDEIAYEGDGPPETVAPQDNWQRFLDLVDEHGAGDRADSLVRAWAAPGPVADLLDARAAARDRYAALVEAGRGWAAPLGVRTAMGSWLFTRATTRMDGALHVLDLRDAIDTEARALGLTPDDALEAAYEASGDSYDAAEALAASEQAALDRLETARDALAAAPGFVASVGLIGSTPTAGYEAARTAFEQGDLAGVATGVDRTLAVLAGAEQAGMERLVVAGIVLAAFVVLLVLARRHRRGTVLAPGFAVQPEPAAASPAEPYGTLADHAPEAPGATGAAADGEGGRADRDGPSPTA